MTYKLDNIYIISDTHFNHEAIIKYCNRPENHEVLMFYNLMKLSSQEILIHLGDVCMGKDAEMHSKYIKPLRCKKILVRGNHDTKPDMFYLNHGWDWVCRTYSTKYFNKKILFSHEPKAWDGKYEFNVHGHFHTLDHRRFDPEFMKIQNLAWRLYSVEENDYKPVKLKEFLGL